MTEEQDLYVAVVLQAIRDAAEYVNRNGVQRVRCSTYPTACEGAQALKFLRARSGEWAESREQVCGAAGLDPDALRERIEADLARDGNLSVLQKEIQRPGPWRTRTVSAAMEAGA